jgi:hypothetical protein
VTQVVEQLPSKSKALSTNPRAIRKKKKRKERKKKETANQNFNFTPF